MTNETCENCRWFKADRTDDGPAEGNCMRHAPKPVTRWQTSHEFEDEKSDTRWRETVWPPVWRVDFCGEWQAKPPRYDWRDAAAAAGIEMVLIDKKQTGEIL